MSHAHIDIVKIRLRKQTHAKLRVYEILQYHEKIDKRPRANSYTPLRQQNLRPVSIQRYDAAIDLKAKLIYHIFTQAL